MGHHAFAQGGLHIVQLQHGGAVLLNQPRRLAHIITAPRHGEGVVRAQIFKIAQQPSVRGAEQIIVVPPVLPSAARQNAGIPNRDVFQFQTAAQFADGLPGAAGDGYRHSRVIAAHGRGRSHGHRWRADLRRLAGQAAAPLGQRLTKRISGPGQRQYGAGSNRSDTDFFPPRPVRKLLLFFRFDLIAPAFFRLRFGIQFIPRDQPGMVNRRAGPEGIGFFFALRFFRRKGLRFLFVLIFSVAGKRQTNRRRVGIFRLSRLRFLRRICRAAVIGRPVRLCRRKVFFRGSGRFRCGSPAFFLFFLNSGPIFRTEYIVCPFRPAGTPAAVGGKGTHRWDSPLRFLRVFP